MKFTILTSALSLLILALGAHAQVSGTDSGSATVLPTSLPGDSSLPPTGTGTGITDTSLPTTSSGVSSEIVSGSDTVIDTSTFSQPAPTPTLPLTTLSTSDILSSIVPTGSATTTTDPASTSNAAFALALSVRQRGGTFVAVLGGIVAAIL